MAPQAPTVAKKGYTPASSSDPAHLFNRSEGYSLALSSSRPIAMIRPEQIISSV